MGKAVRFGALIRQLNTRLRLEDKEDEKDRSGNTEKSGAVLSEVAMLKAREAAEQKLKVMPAIRWQVFQRDNWKCVSCGRNSQNDVILHVDHIIPRSRGGSDSLENYQTLCHLCNIGKSNKDTTDLRLKGTRERVNRHV
jgi:5-methylcytosine-specific restriction endonuclease McrA